MGSRQTWLPMPVQSFIAKAAMKKQCVFCGNRPEAKTKEHVIPAWLIKMTGDPKRMASFISGLTPTTACPSRQFSFDQFSFPACSRCNEKFSHLENNAKEVILNIFNDKTLSKNNILTLLDWFDKVRVGIWLGFFYLDKNFFNIIPNFYINSRIGNADRMLFISVDNYKKNNLSFCGANTPLFSLMPSVFSLRINNIVFTNISYQNALLRRFGFPFLIDTQLESDGYISTNIHDGFKRVMLPIIRKELPSYNLQIYQPIYSGIMQDEAFKSFFDTEYVSKYSDEAGNCGIFYELKKNNVKYLNEDDQVTLNRFKYENYEKNMLDTFITVYELQMMAKLQNPVFNETDPRRAHLIKMQYNFAMNYNKQAIKMFKNQRRIK